MSTLTSEKQLGRWWILLFCLGAVVAFVGTSICISPSILNHFARPTQAKNDAIQLVTGIAAYYKAYSVTPNGTNAQIMASLRGSNPKAIIFFEAPQKKFNLRGDIVDPWGIPYRIDPSNPTFPWAYSFGKDGIDDGGAPGSDDITSW